jgi:ATPase subunit of ABC transporter with duplicated ATPase domains
MGKLPMNDVEIRNAKKASGKQAMKDEREAREKEKAEKEAKLAKKLAKKHGGKNEVAPELLAAMGAGKKKKKKPSAKAGATKAKAATKEAPTVAKEVQKPETEQPKKVEAVQAKKAEAEQPKKAEAAAKVEVKAKAEVKEVKKGAPSPKAKKTEAKDVIFTKRTSSKCNCDKCEEIATSLASILQCALEVGAVVKAQYYGEYYPGKIEKVNSDGTFAVIYDTGDKEASVKREHIEAKIDRQASAQSLAQIMTCAGCAADSILQIQETLKGKGKEAGPGKLSALAVLEALSRESSTGAIEAGNTILRDSLQKELFAVDELLAKNERIDGKKLSEESKVSISFAETVMGQVVCTLGKGSKEAKVATVSAVVAMLSFALELSKIQITVSQITELLEDKQWQVKQAALDVLTGLARQGQSGWLTKSAGANSRLPDLEIILPDVLPCVIELLHSAKGEVSTAAKACLRAQVDLCTHPETIKMKGELVAAMEEPAKTEATLEHLMAMTFVNALQSPALAIIVPVIARALSEGKGALTQKAAAACGSMCALAKSTSELKPFVGALMPGLERTCEHSRPDVRAASQVAKKLLEEGLVAKKGEMCGAQVKEGVDYLVCLEGVILAFASRVLLSQTNLLLEKGRRYAVLGNNGTGKTTLLNRLAAKDISGFPMSVKTHYITHEIPADEASVTCEEYMLKAAGDVKDAATVVQNALDSVGFGIDPITKTPLRKMPITELSGGWRMKLTVARSMLHPIDLLLLDEPTNHLDLAALEWLERYLVDEVGKTDTAICLVTHDYDFLEKVVTDVMHICDKKLGFYPCGFSDFQKQRPDVVAGLPGVNSSKVAAEGVKTFQAASGGATPTLATPPDAPAGGSSTTSMTSPSPNSTADLDNLDQYDIAEIREKRREEKNAAAMAGMNHNTTQGLVLPMTFPDPGKLEGKKGKPMSVLKPVITFKDVEFQYPSADVPQLKGVNAKLCLNSRVVIVGSNGAGKTTLMKLLVGETEPTKDVGEITRHHNLRMSYIAQHSMHHVEDSLDKTPLDYLRHRFFQGQDRELGKMSVLSLTEEEKAITLKRGEVCEVVSRVQRGKDMWYELKKTNQRADRSGVPKQTCMMEIKLMHPYVLKLCRNYDERAKVIASGMDIRPLTTPELRKHLSEFGIDSHLADQKIVGMSGGQKSRLILAAAMWTKPHMIALDEPTNYLDNDTLAALTRELKNFKGAVITVSHHEAFIAALCTQKWVVAGGKLEQIEVLAKTKNDLKDFVPESN